MNNQQLSIKRDWQQEIEALCKRLVDLHKLPKDSIYLAKNMGREGKVADKRDTVISYSICIYEPEYPEIPKKAKDPSRNTVITNIKIVELKTKSNRFEVLVRDNAVDFVGAIPGMNDDGLVPKSYFHKYSFSINELDSIIDGWLDYIERLTEYELKTYVSKATRFACCSHFIECSDAKRCVHTNKLYACACYYKANLDSGKIFYGKNRNTD